MPFDSHLAISASSGVIGSSFTIETYIFGSPIGLRALTNKTRS